MREELLQVSKKEKEKDTKAEQKRETKKGKKRSALHIHQGDDGQARHNEVMYTHIA